jgi:hypothetical protein
MAACRLLVSAICRGSAAAVGAELVEGLIFLFRVEKIPGSSPGFRLFCFWFLASCYLLLAEHTAYAGSALSASAQIANPLSTHPHPVPISWLLAAKWHKNSVDNTHILRRHLDYNDTVATLIAENVWPAQRRDLWNFSLITSPLHEVSWLARPSAHYGMVSQKLSTALDL